MSAALSWYLTVQALGLLTYLIAAPACGRLPDRGYAFSKALGVLLLGLLLWLGAASGLLRNDAGGAVLSVCALAACAAARTPPGGWRRILPPRAAVVSTELLFVAAFGAWCLVRFADPSANHTEQPMDLMLLTAVASSPTFPPADPWLAGYPIGYYYLGYWLMAAVGHLTGQPPAVSYNVGQACWFGLLATATFGLAWNLTAANRGDASPRSHAPALAAGGIAVAAVTLAATLVHPVQLIAAWLRGSGAPSGHWWWWQSSRAIVDVDPAGRPVEVIAEFPFFSYLLGDNHPHLLAMPFVALTAGLAFNLWLAAADRDQGAVPYRERPESGARWLFGLPVLAMAALVPLNTWDAASGGLILMPALAAAAFVGHPAGSSTRARAGQVTRVAGLLCLTAAAVLLLTSPFFLTAQSQVTGLLPNLFHPTALSQFATVFGALVPGAALMLWMGWRTPDDGRRRVLVYMLWGLGGAGLWLAGASLAVASGAPWLPDAAEGIERPLAHALARWLAGWPVLALLVAAIAIGGASLREHARRPQPGAAGVAFGLALTVVGLVLALVPELVYVRDAFGTRMNTVFKFYYQAWLLLGVGAALGITLGWRLGGAPRVAAAGAALVLGMGLVYAPAALRAKLQAADAATGTFDALAFVARLHPDQHAAIEWVRANTRPGSVIAQAPGDSYHPLDNLISTATARPALLGWEGHERQWRGRAFEAMTAGRHEALTRIFRPVSESDLQQTLDEWNVAYVLVGPAERDRYAISATDETRMRRALDLVFEQGAVRIYRRRG